MGVEEVKLYHQQVSIDLKELADLEVHYPFNENVFWLERKLGRRPLWGQSFQQKGITELNPYSMEKGGITNYRYERELLEDAGRMSVLVERIYPKGSNTDTPLVVTTIFSQAGGFRYCSQTAEGAEDGYAYGGQYTEEVLVLSQLLTFGQPVTPGKVLEKI